MKRPLHHPHHCIVVPPAMKPFLCSHIILLLFLHLPLLSSSLELCTDGRWIVDESGHRVKLACVNWASHIDTMVTEGLNKQPLATITAYIAALGFNCVRLTYATYMVTREEFLHLTVRQSLLNHGLKGAIDGILAHNPNVIDLTLIESFKVSFLFFFFSFTFCS